MRIFTRELYDRLEENEDSLYTSHFIRKSNGRGTRRIDEPAAELKDRQRLALKVLNRRHPMLLHHRACGCVPRMDVRSRVLEHVGWKWSMTTDIKDFYPTVTWEMLCAIEPLQQYMDNEDLRCCCRTINGQLVLPQGAPTSPMLANISLTEFDQNVIETISEWEDSYERIDIFDNPNRAHYSRYMDDILVSINCGDKGKAVNLQNRVLNLVTQHGFAPNRRKTKLKPYSQKQKWIGFNLVVSDTMSRGPKVDKRYVEGVIDEGLRIVNEESRDPLEDLSWKGKLEYIRYNDVGRFWRVKRKICLELYVQGLEIQSFYRGTGVISRHLERNELTGRNVIRDGETIFETYDRNQHRAGPYSFDGSSSSSITSSSTYTAMTGGTPPY